MTHYPFISMHILALKAPAKKSSENAVCFKSHLLHIYLTNISIGANSVDPRSD